MGHGPLRVVLATLASLCSAGAAAQAEGSFVHQEQYAYVGLTAGQSKARNSGSCSDLSGLFSPGFSCSIEDTDVAWKVFAGYQADRHIAVEVSYVDLGTFKLSASGLVTGVPVSASEKLHAYGFGADLVLSAPVSDEFALFLRVGLLAWTLKDSASASSNVASNNQQQKATGTGVTFGAGARYDFAEDVGLRIEFQRFKDIGDENKTGQSDVDVISASLVWRFR